MHSTQQHEQEESRTAPWDDATAAAARSHGTRYAHVPAHHKRLAHVVCAPSEYSVPERLAALGALAVVARHEWAPAKAEGAARAVLFRPVTKAVMDALTAAGGDCDALVGDIFDAVVGAVLPEWDVPGGSADGRRPAFVVAS